MLNVAFLTTETMVLLGFNPAHPVKTILSKIFGFSDSCSENPNVCLFFADEQQMITAPQHLLFLTAIEMVAQILRKAFVVHGADLLLQQFADAVGCDRMKNAAGHTRYRMTKMRLRV